jgi:3-oxoacyl-[acyl-carrier-protein] synthase-1
MTRVRIRGLGLLTSYGMGLAGTVTALQQGRSGITPLTLFPLSFADRFQVNQFDHARFPTDEAGTEELLLYVARDALAQSGLAHAQSSTLRDCALVLGTSGFLFAAETEYRRHFAATGAASTPPLRAAGWYAARVAQRLGITGPVFTLSTACSSSANALLAAADLIVRGEVQRALVIGVEGLSSIALTGFQSLMLLDPDGCRPFDAERAGLQLGEGVGALVLEAETDAAARGDFLRGGANLCDIHHVTSASPDGSAMHAVMQQALATAALDTQAIRAIKAHGTGSEDNDAAEAAAMRTLFDKQPPPFTALKRYVGHTLGACGAIETAAFLGCLRAGFIPATGGFLHGDAALQVQPLTHAMSADGGHYMLNFFGFGGNYASLVITHD